MKVWRISIGLYPGILIGIRSYDLDDVGVTRALSTVCRYSFRNN
jgi:hypothetical protein